jgi:electron transfer flavoprotein alpha subunit
MTTTLVWSPERRFAFELIAKAKGLGDTVVAVAMGPKLDKVEEFGQRGADKVVTIEDPRLASLVSSEAAQALAAAATETGAQRVFITGTRRGKEIAPRLAARLNAACITLASAAEANGGKLEFTRMFLGGKTQATEVPTTPIVVATFPPRLFEPLPADPSKKAPTQALKVQIAPSPLQVLGVRPRESSGVNLEEASTVVAAGRGIKKKDDLKLAFDLAAALGGQVGCSRPLATDLGWLTDEYWIGLSGKEVKPKLYLALGISGQIQHVTGIRNSKVIVAVNTNKDAPIFKVADYGVVQDLYKFVPAFIKEVQKAKQG